jgi:hypothetical protein
MKRLLLMLLCIHAVAVVAAPVEAPTPNRVLSSVLLDTGRLTEQTGNYGVDQTLTYQNSVKLIDSSSIWVSGKKNRRDSFNRLLYWLTYPPTPGNDALIYEGHGSWSPDLVIAKDTLSSVGYDGDLDLYELLPAYNPLAIPNSHNIQNFDIYNPLDQTLLSVNGEPGPLLFDPFNSTNYCFSIPQQGSFDTPGFFTHSSYYYDICPFGTPGDRDFGSSRNQSTHYPLDIAVHQETYSWPVQDHDDFVVSKYTVYNRNALDSIEDLALAYLMDPDIGPVDWGGEIAADDISGYVKGPGYEFVYARDADGDDGLSTVVVANKILVPNRDLMNAAWYWRVGHGPNDKNSRSLTTLGQPANQKYWLVTGRNPDDSKYSPLRLPDPIMEYEQPSPNDTRSLHALFGAQPGMAEYQETDAEGNYINRLSLEPGASISFYVVRFVAESLDELKAKSLEIENFMEGGMIIPQNAPLASVPYIPSISKEGSNTFLVQWNTATNPAHFEIKYKLLSSPEDVWNTTLLSPDLRHYRLSCMLENTDYQIKLCAVFYLPNEIRKESQTHVVNLSTLSVDDELVYPLSAVRNYPNPFKLNTTIEFELKQAGLLKADVYNVRGQKVRKLQQEQAAAGNLSLHWDGTDDAGKRCAPGVYFLRLDTPDQQTTHKMLLTK